MLIILGDAGINYFLNEEDIKLKEYLNNMNIKLFCIQGNHEERPENISTYKEIDMFGGKVFDKDEFCPKHNKDGYEIVRDAYSQKEVMKEDVICPKCHSKDISVIKGDGYSISGADFIGIVCNDCKKVYGFNDVKYKPNCPKEL